jgi:hypothetical protein
MNPLFEQLAKNAGINLTPAQFSGVLEDEVDEFTLQKFAELIVKECAEVANEHDCNQSGNAGEILNYFGVEE